MSATALTRPALGYGLGLRTTHYQTLLSELPPLDWLEVLSENYMVAGGKPLDYLDRIRAHYPVVMHGVSLSIGSSDPLDQNYLRQLKTLAQRIEPHWISDHLCWTGVQHKNMHDLLPLPYTEEALRHVVARIRQVQDYLGQRILIENVSSYLTYTASDMSEWEFLRAVCEQADCLLLLDINNIYVSARNHGFDPLTFLEAIPVERVQQFHLAGHSMNGDMIIDTHDAPVIDPVWALYAQAVRRFGAVSTLLERDDNIPELPELIAELAHARRLATAILAEKTAAA